MGEFKVKTAKRILEWVKQKAEVTLLWLDDKSEVLRVCQWLYETQNKKLIRDAIGKDLKMDFSKMTLSPLDCAVLGSVISCCGELEELNRSESNLTPECIRRLTPGLICCRRVKMTSCDVTADCCSALYSTLSAPQSRLTELDLSNNELGDSGVIELCKGLRSENCKLEKLWLFDCHLASRSCSFLSSALCSPHSRLTELDLSDNSLEDSEMDQLCEGLRSENCKLEKLRLAICHLTSRCCSALSSALSSPNLRLTELDLRANQLEDSGMVLLCEGLRSENCKVKKLWLSECGLTSRCCSALSKVFSSPNSRLTELELGKKESIMDQNINKLEDSGVAELCEGLRSENCKLEKLNLSDCGLTSRCCSALSSALSTPHSRLTELDLSSNNMEDSGVDQLCEGLRSENCKLEKLSLSECGLTSTCGSFLSSVISSPHSRLTELDLSGNRDFGDSDIAELCEGLRSENCKLEKLR
uniref:Ribonuclease inhibitor-like n=1 Tax=Erpetoichthys calabaricus TaxID=27687 RepID=A0A8C4TQ24_ERPCA